MLRSGVAPSGFMRYVETQRVGMAFSPSPSISELTPESIQACNSCRAACVNRLGPTTSLRAVVGSPCEGRFLRSVSHVHGARYMVRGAVSNICNSFYVARSVRHICTLSFCRLSWCSPVRKFQCRFQAVPRGLHPTRSPSAYILSPSAHRG